MNSNVDRTCRVNASRIHYANLQIAGVHIGQVTHVLCCQRRDIIIDISQRGIAAQQRQTSRRYNAAGVLGDITARGLHADDAAIGGAQHIIKRNVPTINGNVAGDAGGTIKGDIGGVGCATQGQASQCTGKTIVAGQCVRKTATRWLNRDGAVAVKTTGRRRHIVAEDDATG